MNMVYSDYPSTNQSVIQSSEIYPYSNGGTIIDGPKIYEETIEAAPQVIDSYIGYPKKSINDYRCVRRSKSSNELISLAKKRKIETKESQIFHQNTNYYPKISHYPSDFMQDTPSIGNYQTINNYQNNYQTLAEPATYSSDSFREQPITYYQNPTFLPTIHYSDSFTNSIPYSENSLTNLAYMSPSTYSSENIAKEPKMVAPTATISPYPTTSEMIFKDTPSYGIGSDLISDILPNISIPIGINGHTKQNIDQFDETPNIVNSNINYKYPTSSLSSPFGVSTDEPGEKFNPSEFDILSEVGKGGFGCIYKARWSKNGQLYAMKIEKITDVEELNESKMKTQLMINFLKNTGCTGIIKVYGDLSVYNHNDGSYTHYLLMELSEGDWGDELYDRLTERYYYTEGELTKIMSQLIHTLATLQREGITHRDIKPKNVLISRDGYYKLCDFGEAVVISPYCNESRLVRGTSFFMSPKVYAAYHNHQIDLHHNSFKSDVFSVGICIYLAAKLTGDNIESIRKVVDGPYSTRQHVINFLTQSIGSRYSMNFIRFLSMLLDPDENTRPDFIQLEGELRM